MPINHKLVALYITGERLSKCKVIANKKELQKILIFEVMFYRKILGLSINYILYLIVAVITSFLICWTPYHVLRNVYVITSITKTRTSSVVNAEETLHVLSGKPLYLIILN